MATELRDESRMIASILAGDGHLFHKLIRPYERRVYAMALSFLRNEADAEDATQETFLKAFRNLASFRGDAKFGTWLVSIALNEARSRIRRRDAIKVESLDEPVDEDGHTSPALLRDWKEIRQLLHKAVTALPLIYREVFQLRDIEQMSVNEAAAALGITISSVKVRLHRARMMLQKALAPQLQQMVPKRRRWAW